MTTLAKRARVVERDVFGALIGALVGLTICRLSALVIDINPFALIAMLLIGSWSGAFVAHIGVRRSVEALDSMRSVASAIRAICLRTILWLLGIASVLGVLAVLTGSFEVVGRVAATAAVTAFAALVLWPLLRLFDEGKNWRVGLFGTVSVVAAYLLGMPSIWELGFRPEESSLSGLTIALMMPVGLIAMYLSNSRATRVAGFVSVLIYAVSTTLFLVAIWFADDWRFSEKAVQTGMFVLSFGALAVVTTVNAATGDRRYWRWIGFAAAAIAAGMCINNLSTRGLFDEKLIIAITSVAVVIAHANMALLASLRSGQLWWRYATILATATTAVALDADLFLTVGRSHGISMLGRVALASGILASTGTLALMILTRLNRSVTATIGPISSVDLCCPRCGKRRNAPLGRSTCESCGVSITIAIDEPDRVD